ncbi:MAG: FadR family transcriptional regulator [Chloroflexi bacterium]|nr:FadR family transcriptional regulator [Chloroflexota bacterium]
MMNTELTDKSLVEQLTEALMDRIEREQLGPGDRLPTAAALVRIHGVSRPVVREALKILEGRGVVEMTVGRSAVIRPLSEDTLTSFFQRAMSLEEKNFEEVLELRMGVEMQSAKLAAQRRTQEEVEEFQDILIEMESHIDNPDSYADINAQFHVLIAKAAHNTLLFYLISGIRDALRNVNLEGLRLRMNREERYELYNAHKQIVAMIAAKNSEGAAQAMTSHFEEVLHKINE